MGNRSSGRPKEETWRIAERMLKNFVVGKKVRNGCLWITLAEAHVLWVLKVERERVVGCGIKNI